MIIKLELNADNPTPDQILNYKEIFQILLDKGALDGVRGGSAIIHFDAQGIFQGVQLDYWPWRRRKS